jgi:RNA polymerase sigma factor (sigma-70 family)
MTGAVHSGGAGWIARGWTSASAATAPPPAASSDGALVAAATGSPVAFGRVVERHQQALRAFLRRICGDWALADDLAQETFLTAWSGLGRLTPGADVGAWLCGIGYNKYLTSRRGARRARARESHWREAPGVGGGSAPEDRLALKATMAGLPVEQRACVALCLAAGFSHAEAAKALDLPPGTVKSHVARGRARLLLALGEPR